jgi:amidase
MGGLGRLASEAVETSLEAVLRADVTVKAWAHIDPERARREAASAELRGVGRLSGLVVGVKDIFDTFDQPTQYGSSIYTGYRPVADAAAVALLREAGAVCLGKTVTAEFAYRHPGPTANPHRPTHTPGGSSMGSAAAVAAGMVDVGLGTQSGDSVVKPASFCGVYGFKPTFGTVSTSGVKALAPSLDTVGWLARDPFLLDEVRVQLTGRKEAPQLRRSPVIGLLRTPQWEECTGDSRQAVVAVADIAQALGADVTEVQMPAPAAGLGGRHIALMAYEAARSLAWEYRVRRDKLSPEMRELLDYGRSVEPTEVDEIQAQRAAALASFAEIFTRFTVLLTPVADGEAPVGLASTGTSRFGRLWTLLGLPAISVPAATGQTGLPVGVQLIGGAGDDGGLLAATIWLTGGKSVPPTGPVPYQGLLA